MDQEEAATARGRMCGVCTAGQGSAAPPQAVQSAAAAPSYEEFSTDFHDETDGGSVANWIGGLCSLVLLIGLGFWGYQTIQRDVSGVPVIQALPGPMRVQPADPEGLQASHQGLSVNTVQAEGRASEPPAQVVLAPQPLDLSAEGIAAATLPPPSSSQNGSAATTPAPQSELGSAEQTAAFAALADQLAAGSAPLGDLSAPTGTAPTAQPVPGPSQLQVISASIPGVAQSPRPPSRPARTGNRLKGPASEKVLASARAIGGRARKHGC